MAIVITLGVDRLRQVEFNGSSVEREIEIALWRHLIPLVDRIDTKVRRIYATVQREVEREKRAGTER